MAPITRSSTTTVIRRFDPRVIVRWKIRAIETIEQVPTHPFHEPEVMSQARTKTHQAYKIGKVTKKNAHPTLKFNSIISVYLSVFSHIRNIKGIIAHR